MTFIIKFIKTFFEKDFKSKKSFCSFINTRKSKINISELLELGNCGFMFKPLNIMSKIVIKTFLLCVSESYLKLLYVNKNDYLFKIIVKK